MKAVNALPGVSKIRYVASSLLEELEPQHNQLQDFSRAQDYLGRFRTHSGIPAKQQCNTSTF
jgi:hypothetical protein